MTITKPIFRWAALTAICLLMLQTSQAQITETGTPEKTSGNLVLHTLAVNGNTSGKPVAMFYFYRSYMSKIFAPLKKMSLYVNDTLIYELKANSIVSYPVYHAGKFKVSGDSKDKTSMIVSVKPGKEYFFHCWLPTGIFDPPMQIESVLPKLAKQEIGLPDEGVSEMAGATTPATAMASHKDSVIWGDTSFKSERQEPKFPGGITAWVQFLQQNLNTKLGKKYIPLLKNEPSATQVAMVSFLIDKTGNVIEVKIENPDEIHPKLAEEAIRVISKSPSWIPATINGEKVVFRQKQSITFEVNRG